MVTLSATIALLQMMSILPTMGICRTCKVPTPKWKEESWIFWQCGTCPGAAGHTGLRANTVLEHSKLKLERFVMLLWHFADRGKTYSQISNAASLPAQSHYVEDKLSSGSISKWNKYLRYICKEDYLKNRKQIGGKDCIVEIDETMNKVVK